MRLIDADALWKTMCEYDDYQGAREAHDLELIHRDSILFAIEQAPTIDAISMREWNLLRNSIQELQENNPEKKDIQFVTKFLLRLMDISKRRDKNEV